MAIYFYSHRLEYGCFSNFSDHAITVDGVTWPTTEHYFQAMKFPHDPKRQGRIRKTSDPGQSKRIAWESGAEIVKHWDSKRDEVMLTALRAKFTQHADLQAILLGTGDETLVEHTNKDRYWGDGGDGSGENKLGQLLMRVRAELRAQVADREQS